MSQRSNSVKTQGYLLIFHLLGSTIRIGASKFGEIIMAAKNNDEQWSSDIAKDIKYHYGI